MSCWQMLSVRMGSDSVSIDTRGHLSRLATAISSGPTGPSRRQDYKNAIAWSGHVGHALNHRRDSRVVRREIK